MARMPSLPRSARRRLLPAALLLALVACWPALAARPANIELTITKPDGTKEFVRTSDVANPDIDARYLVRQADGSTKSIQVEDGISLRALLAEAEAELGYRKIELANPNGGVVSLTREQVDAPSPPPPVLYADETGATWFLRSPTSSTEANAKDHFAVSGSALALDEVGAELTVEVKASPSKADPGEPVRFTASVSGGPSDADYTYNWVFDDGKKKDDGGSTVTHRFEEAGNYKVVVGVKIDDAQRSDSGHVRVQVGDPKQSDQDREGGGDNGGAAAPDSGASTGSSGDSGATYTPPYTPPAPALPPAPTPPPTPTPDPPKSPDVATSGTTVEGNLLADVGDPPPSNILESAARAARGGNPKDDAPDGADVPEAALSIAGVLALLGLGAGIESRQGRLPRLRLPRLALPRRGA
jgi:plastocyanin